VELAGFSRATLQIAQCTPLVLIGVVTYFLTQTAIKWVAPSSSTMSLSMNGFPPLEDPNAVEELEDDDVTVSLRSADVMIALAEQGFNATEYQDLASLIIDSLIEMLATDEPNLVAIETITRLDVAQENLMFAEFQEEDGPEDLDTNTAVFTDPIVLN
jgi:hypothetical protein